MNQLQSVPLDSILEDLREKLVEEFDECGENCTRAYYNYERDSDDHEASNALRVLEPLMGLDLRDELRDAYKADREELSLYDLREGEKSTHDRYALVAIRVARPLLTDLVESGMGGTAV